MQLRVIWEQGVFHLCFAAHDKVARQAHGCRVGSIVVRLRLGERVEAHADIARCGDGQIGGTCRRRRHGGDVVNAVGVIERDRDRWVGSSGKRNLNGINHSEDPVEVARIDALCARIVRRDARFHTDFEAGYVRIGNADCGAAAPCVLNESAHLQG